MKCETNRIEFKRELTDKFEREVIAFLNYSGGGVIYIGVDDDGNAVGVENIDDVQLKISSRIRDNIQPATLGLFDVVVETLQGKEIIKVVVSGGNEKPYYLRSKGMTQSGCFLRVGSGVQSMTDEMILNFFSRRTRNSLRNIRSPRKGLTFEQLKIYYEEHGHKLNANFLQSLDLLTPDGDLNYLAYLLADENGTSIKVAKYAGTNKVDLIQNEEYGYCSLIKATKAVLDKFNIENITRAKITYKERIEKNLVNKVALREAIINAIVHNDYSSGVPPVFEIFSNRFTVTSYGGLIDGFSKEDFFKCCSNPRNRELMRIFKDVELVEQLGSGMERILAAYDQSIFEWTPNFMKVVFKFEDWAGESINDESSVQADDITRKETRRETKRETRKEILEIIRKKSDVTMSEMAKQLGLSYAGIVWNIEKLKKQGVLVRVGATKNGHWKVNE